MNIELLKRRAELMRALRSFFDAHGFTEVTTSVRIAAPAPEPHIDCPPVAGGKGPSFLRASPELKLKKLLAGGMELVYEIGPCFREGEFGSRHRPEFTMLEWYRRGEDYLAIAADLEALLRTLAALSPALAARLGAEPFRRLTVREAYRRYAGWDPWCEWDQDRFDFDMATKVEPSLPPGPVFLMDYPVAASSLARLRGDVAERWEFYFDSLELGNCFTELCDADEQRRRFEAARAERRRLEEADYPLDEEFLALLPRIGSAAGVAVGVDRLMMLLLGERDLGAVMAGE